MKELDLYKFLEKNTVEMRWDGIKESAVLSAWIPAHSLTEFTEMIASSLNDGGRTAHLCSRGFIWVDLSSICEHYGIDPEKIFPISK